MVARAKGAELPPIWRQPSRSARSCTLAARRRCMLFQSVFTRRLSRVFEWLISLALLMSATVAGSGEGVAATQPLRRAKRYERRYGCQASRRLFADGKQPSEQ